MKPIWKRCMVFLLILVMVLGILPVANASQIEPTQIPEETAAPETIMQTEEPTTETTAPTVQDETLPEETIPFIAGNVESSIALLADAEIVGAPNAFANLTLQNGGIDIPAQGYIQHKNILPLYSLYLTYLPTDKFKYALKMNVDNRGSFTELVHTADCGQVSINISRPGITRGQHWHNSKWELFIVVAGHGLIQERNINTGEMVEFEVSGDKIEAVHMIPGWTHNIINLSETENLVTVMTCNEIFNPNHPDTFYEEV